MKKAILFSIILGCFFTASARSVDKDHLITKTSIGRAKLGMPFNKFISYFKYDTMEVGENGHICLIKNGKEIIWINDNKLGKDSIVRWVILLSDRYYTKDSIHVGTSIKKFMKVHKQIKMEHDEHDGVGVFTLGSQNLSMIFNLEPFNINKPLYDENNVDQYGVVHKYSTQGYISSIELILYEKP
jgi:hypothetical protein